MKNLEFKEYTHYYDDADGDEQSSSVMAAVVDKGHVTRMVESEDGTVSRVSTKRYVATLDGRQALQLGDVVVETARPGVYDVLSAEQWAANGYELEDDSDAPTPDPKTVPAKKTAAAPAR
jgi:hypothetical protein